MTTWTCRDCGYETSKPVDGVDVIAVGRQFYCAKCASCIFVNGKPQLRDFPSKGKMERDTLMLDCQEDEVWLGGSSNLEPAKEE